MTDAFAALADADVRGAATFTLDPEHATAAFGAQEDPPGEPAATDAAPGEATPVLGTAYLLAHFGTVSREALRGYLPDGSGVVERGASVSHLAPVAVGGEVTVTATLVGVDRPDLSFACRAERDDGTAVATGDLSFRVVDREQFREAVGRE
ncbi:MAG: thioesterase family protein [Halobacterium sp.]